MKIGICGAGTMGSGIAINAIQNGHTALLFDVQEKADIKAESFIQKQIDKGVARGKMTTDEAEKAFTRFSFTDRLTEFFDCDFIIEAIIEDRDIKVELFRKIERIIPETTILATNTSSISVTALGAALEHPHRFVGMHFFNPAHIMKLVEVIRGKRTSDETIERTIELAKSLRKTPAVAKDVPGFIVNRVARNYYNEAMRIVMEGGASLEQVDTLLKAAGFKMGPFELMDLIGVDTNFAVTQSVWKQYFYEPRFTPSPMQEEYVNAGLHGRKAGEVFYKYDS